MVSGSAGRGGVTRQAGHADDRRGRRPELPPSRRRRRPVYRRQPRPVRAPAIQKNNQKLSRRRGAPSARPIFDPEYREPERPKFSGPARMRSRMPIHEEKE